MRGYWSLLLPCLLTGCFLPPAVSVASLVVDGASYVVTGKSVADHGLSIIANEDCATWRVIKGEAICQPNNRADPQPTETAVATADEPGVDSPDSGSAPTGTGTAKRPGNVSSAMLAISRSPTPFNLRPIPNPRYVLPAAGAAQPRPPRPTTQIADTQEPGGEWTPEWRPNVVYINR